MFRHHLLTLVSFQTCMNKKIFWKKFQQFLSTQWKSFGFHHVKIDKKILFQTFLLYFKFNCYVSFRAWGWENDECSFLGDLSLSLRSSLQRDVSLDNLATVPLYADPQTSCTWHGCVELTGSMKNSFSALMKNKTSFEGASVYVSRHSFLADLCNMLLWCLWLPQSASRLQFKKKYALKTVVGHHVMHADGWMDRWGGTVH